MSVVCRYHHISGDNNIESMIACFPIQTQDARWASCDLQRFPWAVGDLAACLLWSGPGGYRPDGLPRASRRHAGGKPRRTSRGHATPRSGKDHDI